MVPKHRSLVGHEHGGHEAPAPRQHEPSFASLRAPTIGGAEHTPGRGFLRNAASPGGFLPTLRSKRPRSCAHNCCAARQEFPAKRRLARGSPAKRLETRGFPPTLRSKRPIVCDAHGLQEETGLLVVVGAGVLGRQVQLKFWDGRAGAHSPIPHRAVLQRRRRSLTPARAARPSTRWDP